ncbi:hypothetical protein OG946_12920 [Streptomyces sp. NBC_01808]|uniref:hypothetical protein n=1 Tax=Streptomyces sp. NBC_01808 TaxID=2975947 RepID=UPI002DD9925B|nr:hypothetical protein [Streptomyces sp. NBC_01808]WSA38193.1 hypothetical protein OG946_12920 [Streptomyces sp. NBC_01808]
MSARDPEIKSELDATLQTRRDLGPEYEEELIEGFLEKVQQRMDGTFDTRLRRQLAEQQMQVARGTQPGASSTEGTFGERFGFAAVSMVLAIPLSAIGVVNEGLAGLLVTWGGIVGVNAVHATGLFRRRRAERDKSDWD